jgi:2-oxoisovalerate dehydrogenase E1 component beta subunit
VSGEGIDVEVVDLRTLRPLDKETVLNSVKKTGKLLIVHEDNVTGGVGAEIAALVADEAFEYLDGPVKRLCGPDVPTMPFAQTLEDEYMPNTDKIVQALRKQAAY